MQGTTNDYGMFILDILGIAKGIVINNSSDLVKVSSSHSPSDYERLKIGKTRIATVQSGPNNNPPPNFKGRRP